MSTDNGVVGAECPAESGADADGSVGTNLILLFVYPDEDSHDSASCSKCRALSQMDPDPETVQLLALQAADPEAWGSNDHAIGRDRRIDSRGRQTRRRRVSDVDLDIQARVEAGLLPAPTRLEGWFDDELGIEDW